MKKVCLIAVLIIQFTVFISFGNDINTEDGIVSMESIIYEQMENMDIKDIENMIDIVNENYDDILPRMSLKKMVSEMVKGKAIFDYKDIINNLMKYFMHEIYVNINFAFQILVIVIIIGLLKNTSNSFGESTVSNLGRLICYTAAVALCIGNFRYAYTIGSETINSMISFMQAVFPLIITLLISLGNIASGSLYHPLILASINIVSSLTQTIVLPAVFLSAIFFLVNSMTENSYIKKLASIVRQFAVIFMGFTVTILSGITAIQGIVTSSADGVLVKTAKFSVDKFIPIIGSYISDSVDLILSCSALIKNALGAIGLLVIILIILMPVLKLLAIAIIYKGLSILVEPLGIKNVSDGLNEMGNTIIILISVLLLVALMFLIMITILIKTGNSAIISR